MEFDMSHSHYRRAIPWAARVYLGVIICALLASAAPWVFSQAVGDPGTGSNIAFGVTYNGTTVQSEKTVGKTLVKLLNYLGFSVMPLVGTAFGIVTIFAWFSGRNYGRTLVATIMCLSVAGIVRLLEYLVRQAGN